MFSQLDVCVVYLRLSQGEALYRYRRITKAYTDTGCRKSGIIKLKVIISDKSKYYNGNFGMCVM